MGALFLLAGNARAVILWTDPDMTLIHTNGAGTDILGGAVKRDDFASDTLYFKFHVNPLSDKDTEEYAAAFELYEGDQERLGVGNALKAWAYSAFFGMDEMGESNHITGYIDLHTLKPEPAASGTSDSYQYPRRGVGTTIVYKIQYIPGEDDLVTIWLNPDLGPGANEAYQPDALTTRFNAKATFDEIRLRHSGKGGGWEFSDLAIATAFSDFVDASSARPSETGADAFDGVRTLNFQSWQREQGLPQSPLRALTQTHDGYLWLGGDDGLARFDGLRFATFGPQEGVKTGSVSVLFEDSRDALWIGSAGGGLGYWQNNQFTALPGPGGAHLITALAEDEGGRLWVGTDRGLALWQNGKWLTVPATDTFKGRRVTGLLKDTQGTIWMGVAGAGVFRCLNDQFVPVAGKSADPWADELLRDSHCLLIDQAGNLWLGAGADFVLCREGNRWHRYRITRDEAKGPITTLAEASDGTIWAGSAEGGLLQFQDGKFVSVPANSGLAGNAIESLLADHEGRLWAGTDTGLNRLHRKSLFALSQGEGLGFGAVQCLAEVSPGVVWAGKPNDGLYRWDGRSFNRLSAAGLSSHDSQITALLVTRDGICWVATTNSLLLYKDPIAAADEVKVIKPAEPDIIALAEDRDGVLWVGTRGGQVWRLHENKWLQQTNFLGTNAVTAIVAAADGAMWIGTDGSGIYQFKSGNCHHLGRADGLAGDAIRTLYPDEEGAIWIGTVGNGLSRWADGRLANFTPREGLPEEISEILEDEAGNLWLGSGSGIACVNKASLNELAAGKITAVYPQLFGRADGMLSEECTGGFCPAGLKAKSGQLWFPTLKGVVVINPKVQPASAHVPRAMLEEVRVDGVPVPLRQEMSADPASASEIFQPLRIVPGKHRVEFGYTGLNFDAPELIRFRYRLEGLDTDWVEAGTRRTAFYSYLPPGEYRFHIATCGSNGIWNDRGPVLELAVLRYFWQTWWFITLTAVGVMILVGGVVRVLEKRKLHQRLKRLEQERALERERTRIAQDLHDEMGAKLCRISFLSEHARRGELPPQELKDQITSISDASREVLHSLDEIVWAVNPQNDTLEHVASYIGQYAEEYFQMTGIECTLDIPTQLPPVPLSSQMRHHLFLSAHEAITNILKHAGATRAGIAMQFDGEQFEIRVSDNGKGFNAAKVAFGNGSVAAAAGNGLVNMRRRLAEIGGSCTVESVPGQGTQIRFVIALKSSDSPKPR
jgi:signal transduction histidine kinase/ligand-binding sensor domain-containing protein